MYFPNVFLDQFERHLSICICITFCLKFDNKDGVAVISYQQMKLLTLQLAKSDFS